MTGERLSIAVIVIKIKKVVVNLVMVVQVIAKACEKECLIITLEYGLMDAQEIELHHLRSFNWIVGIIGVLDKTVRDGLCRLRTGPQAIRGLRGNKEPEIGKQIPAVV